MNIALHKIMMYQASKITDHLFQGGLPPRGDYVKQMGMDVLVLAASENQDKNLYTDVIVICAPGDDEQRKYKFVNFVDTWRDAADKVVEHVNAGKNVLVTCLAGQNRSGFITALALQKLTGWSGKECVKHIQKQRNYALNNLTFVDYICESFPKVSKDD